MEGLGWEWWGGLRGGAEGTPSGKKHGRQGKGGPRLKSTQAQRDDANDDGGSLA